MLRELRVLRHLPVFAVHRHEIARTHQVQNQPQFFRAAVSGHVDRRIHGAVDHVRAALGEVVDHPVNGFFVSGNDARAEDHRVARAQPKDSCDYRPPRATAPTSARPACPKPPPPAFSGAVCMMSCGRSRIPSGMRRNPSRMRDLGGVVHAAPEERHFAAVLAAPDPESAAGGESTS